MLEHENTLPGVRCEVKNCIHNNGCCCCTAKQVEVCNTATNPEDTRCATFTEL